MERQDMVSWRILSMYKGEKRRGEKKNERGGGGGGGGEMKIHTPQVS